MATTTNFGWETPDDTDLVKDGAAAIRTALGGVDTSFVDLKGGTTGQVLAKASNTDLDFVWSADAAGMTNPMTTTGDVIYSSSGSTPARLGIGSTGQVLTVSGGLPAWSSPGSSKTWTLLSTTSMSGSSSVTVTGISAKEDVLVLVVGATFSSTNNSVRFRINGDTGANYSVQQNSISPASTYADNAFNGFNSFGGTYIALGTTATNTASQSNASIVLSGCKSTGIKNVDYTAGATEGGGNDHTLNWGQGIYNGSAAVTNITVYSTATFNGGTIYVYGA